MSYDSEEFNEALDGAFNLASLKEMLFNKLKKDLEHFDESKGKPDTILNIIQAAEKEGWLDNLVRAAHSANPNNERLKRFHDAYFADRPESDGELGTIGPPPRYLDTWGGLGEWWEMVAAAAAFLIVLIVIIASTGAIRLVAALIAAAMIFVGVWGYLRGKKRTERRAWMVASRRRWESDRRRRNAFRGLYPFEEGDRLPGDARVREARAIADRVGLDDFRFGVVCGDSGCGKTSLLRAEVEGVLASRGFAVTYLRTPRRLTANDDAAPAEPDARLGRLLESLRSRLPAGARGVLILDQFEDFFLEFTSEAARQRLGAFLSEVIAEPDPVHVLCAVRREYLIDIHDLTPALAEPITARNLFHLKNFDVNQATGVILQCAEADGLALDPGFAELIASDLQEEGFVRPPELQLVCTYLGSELHLDRYRLSGGAAGSSRTTSATRSNSAATRPLPPAS